MSRYKALQVLLALGLNPHDSVDGKDRAEALFAALDLPDNAKEPKKADEKGGDK